MAVSNFKFQISNLSNLWAFIICLTVSFARAQTETAQVFFSPNSDGIIDSAVFRLSVSNASNIAEWVFVVTDNSGREIKRFTGKGAPPSGLDWNGKDEHNQLIPDGTYHYRLSVVTLAGNKVEMPPQELVCDRQTPTAQAGVEPALFSPEEGSAKPTAHFMMDAYDANGIHSWILKIVNAQTGSAVKSFYGKGQPMPKAEWDGRSDAYDPAPDGEYSFTFAVRDRAGNTTITSPKTVTIDRAEPMTSVEAEPPVFSPNADGVQDIVTFEIKPPPVIKKQIENWSLSVKDMKGRALKMFEGLGEPPRAISWDGKDAAGKIAADGIYAYSFLTVDQAGNRGFALPKNLVLDTTPPQATIDLKPLLLSPNGDGFGDNGTYHMEVVEANGIRSYALEIKDDVGTLKKAFRGEETPAKQLQWAGQDSSDKTLVDGKYSYTLTLADRAGNKTTVEPKELQIDVTPPVVDWMVDPRLISPNGDQQEAHMRISVHDASEIEQWRLEIKDAASKVVRRYTGQGAYLDPIAWEGRDESKNMVPDGVYNAFFWVRDKANNAVLTSAQQIVVGAQIPEITVTAALNNFSPNADGVKDTAAFALKSRSFNKIKQWALAFTDGGQTLIREFQGLGAPPAEIIWSGERDDKTPSPDGFYRYVYRVTDEAGNRNQTQPQNIQIDTLRPEIDDRAVPALFSPNADGILDDMIFKLSYRDQSAAREWSITIKNEGNKVVRVLSGQGALPQDVRWDGRSDAQKAVPDGPYTFVLTAEDAVGNRSATLDQIIRLDTTPPQLTIAAEPTLFSPKSSSDKDRTVFNMTVQDASDLTRWSLKFVDAKNNEAHEIKGDGRPPVEIVWEGVNHKNDVLADGSYKVYLVVRDEVGNEGKSQPATVTIDTSKPVVAVVTHEEMVPSLVPEVQSVEGSRGIVINLAAEVLFETGKAQIRPEAFPMLDEAAGVIKKYPKRHVLVEGHTDNVPIRNEEFPNNQTLSEGRAKAVVDYFVRYKQIAAARLTPKGHGDSRPVADNENPENRQKNRRVEIIIEREKPQASSSPADNSKKRGEP